MNLAQPIHKLKQKLNDGFIRNLSWLGAGELVVRLSRLGATVFLARYLSPYDYGLAAIVLTVFEFTQVFTRSGITGKVVQCDAEMLDELAQGAYWLNWAASGAVFLLQAIAAFPVAWFYKDDRLIMPIMMLGLTYLMTPFGRIQFALIQRENRLKIIAISSTIQVSLGNLLTGIFAVMGLGMWAIILPRILTPPIEIFMCLKNCSWRNKSSFTTKHWDEIFRFGINMLGISMLSTLRNNLDYLIVGRFLGLQPLGVYFFAFNAGLGISMSVIMSITMALYPHLCAARTELQKLKERYFKSLKTIAWIIIPVVLLQSSLAPFYVPIVFGQQWISAIPILIIICLSAIPRPFFVAGVNLLSAMNWPNLSLRGDVLFTAIFSLSLLVGVQFGITGVALSVLLSHALVMPLFTIWATRYVFKHHPDQSNALPMA